eukprot:m.96273 g.96273  ORF g.96273 m.96273 type:complete len:65 (+) comp12459_c0_seq13:1161-1355(+)
MLLAKGADVNAADNSNVTPLATAVSNGHVNIVKQLIANGANVNAQTKVNKTIKKGLQQIVFAAV